jgi:hypothetical protein
VSGVSSPASFSLTNTPGSPASITATAGSGQSAAVGTAFATALQATVKDSGNNLLSGVSGWGYPAGTKGSVSMIVRLHYADGSVEDHPLENGVHFADYIRVVDVPGSKLAFKLRGQQLRYLAVYPKKKETIDRLELIKGPDQTAPIVAAVTVEVGNGE